MRMVSAGLLVAAVYWIAQGLGDLIHQPYGEERGLSRTFATVHAGLLLAAACFELLPLSLDRTRWPVTLTGIVAGIGWWICVQLYASRKKGMMPSVSLQTACLGLALGAAYTPADMVGKKLLIVLCLSAFLQTASGNKSGKSNLGRTAIVMLGTALGEFAGETGAELGGACLALACGVLVAASYQYLLPEKNKMETAGAGSMILGLLLGLGIIFL